jgi:hypothetical protein
VGLARRAVRSRRRYPGRDLGSGLDLDLGWGLDLDLGWGLDLDLDPGSGLGPDLDLG